MTTANLIAAGRVFVYPPYFTGRGSLFRFPHYEPGELMVRAGQLDI